MRNVKLYVYVTVAPLRFPAADSGSDDLLKVTLALVPHEPCNESFFDGGNSGQLPLGIVDEWQICAGQTGKDTCQVIIYIHLAFVAEPSALLQWKRSLNRRLNLIAWKFNRSFLFPLLEKKNI